MSPLCPKGNPSRSKKKKMVSKENIIHCTCNRVIHGGSTAQSDCPLVWKWIHHTTPHRWWAHKHLPFLFWGRVVQESTHKPRHLWVIKCSTCLEIPPQAYLQQQVSTCKEDVLSTTILKKLGCDYCNNWYFQQFCRGIDNLAYKLWLYQNISPMRVLHTPMF
jgi:NADH:ubiquinone oxidoreductase subunit